MSDEKPNVVTNEVRCAFPELFKPNEKGKYTVNLLFQKDDPKLLEVCKMILAEVQKVWPDKLAEMKTMIASVIKGTPLPAGFRSVLSCPIKDSEVETPQSGLVPAEDYGYGPCVYMRASTNFKPTVLDANGAAVIAPEYIYGGCYVRAQLNTFTYEKEKKGIGIGLLALLFMRDGERLDPDGEASARAAFGIEEPADGGASGGGTDTGFLD